MTILWASAQHKARRPIRSIAIIVHGGTNVSWDGRSDSPIASRDAEWIAMTDFYMTGSDASTTDSFFISDGTIVNPLRCLVAS